MTLAKKPHVSTQMMEVVVARCLKPRINLIVPNVSWGFFIHECDLLCITPSRYLWEVEIKVSKADLVKDKLKRHRHNSHKIKRLYFAIPDYLEKHIEHIPERAGIIVVNSKFLGCNIIRSAKNVGKYKINEGEYLKLAELGCLRIWGLKETIVNLQQQIPRP